MNCRLRLLLASSLALSFLIAFACGKDSSTKSVVQTPTRIELSPNSATLTAIGQTVQIDATVLDQDSKVISSASVTWASGDATVATVGSSGLVRAVANGITQVTATAGGATASAQVLVAQAANSIVISPASFTLPALGETTQLAATVYDGRNAPIPEAEVTWTTSDPGVATVDGNGRVTAVANGAATITATSGSASATATITVMQTARTAMVRPDSVTLRAIGETAQLTATAIDSSGTAISDPVVTWSSSDPGVATVDREGLVTAAANGVAQISASVGNAQTSATVIVMQTAETITVRPDSVTLRAIGETALLTATATDSGGSAISDPVVNWSSSDPGVATVNHEGLVTAVSNGTATITATLDGASAFATVTVSAIDRIDVLPVSAFLDSAGETVQLTATAFDRNGQVVPEALISWASGNPAVATVDSTGLVTAVANGTATITAAAGDISMDIEVSVSPVVEISLSSTTPTLTALGDTLQMVAAPLDANGEPVPEASIDWSSSRPTVAKVNDTGLVTAKSNGTTLISATSGTAEASVTVTVSQVGVGISITPNIREIFEGQTLQLRTRIVDANDRELRSARVDWSSSRREVATVSRTGLVRAVAMGSTRISATSGDLFITITLRVVAGNGGGVTVDLPGSLETDREGLVALYNALDGPNWTTSTNWLTDEPLGTWAGVTMWSNVDRVGLINLQNNGLNGSLPADISKIGGLGYLRLSDNTDLTGPIPDTIGQLRYLRWLHLHDTSITGPFPSTLTQLADLEQLFVRSDEFMGSIPAGLTGLKKLKHIDISVGSLTGTVPAAFGEMEQLEQLYLSGGLTGGIPSEIGMLRKLQLFSLADNNLTGNIPASIGQVTSLVAISMDNNANMSGTLPHTLTNLSNLDLLSATGTQLCRPSDEAFTTWYESRIPTHRRDQVPICP